MEDFEIVAFSDVPHRCKMKIKHASIYNAAKKLLSVGPGRAIRLKLDGVSPDLACRKAHVFYRRREYRLRTRCMDGSIFMWIEPREVARFEVTSVPLKSKAQTA